MKLDLKKFIAKLLDEVMLKRSIVAQSYQGTTDSAGVLAIPKSVFDISKMHLINIIGITYYAEGIATDNNLAYVRIVRYDGQSVINTQVEVYVYYVKVLD